MKILVIRCFGSFGVSKKAYALYLTKSGVKVDDNILSEPSSVSFLNRKDPILIEVFEELGKKNCDGVNASLAVVEIPDDWHYVISDYDGFETVYCSKEEIIEI